MFRLLIRIAPLGLILAGCADDQAARIADKTVKAAGVLSYQGQPLAHHQVTLIPTGGTPAISVSDEQGNLTFGTNAPGDGAVAGTHKVAVTYVGPPGSTGDGMNDFTPPPPPKVKIPEKYASADTSGVTVEIPAAGAKDLKIDLE